MQAWLRSASRAIVVCACALACGCGDATPKRPEARAAPSYEERVRHVLDRYEREYKPVRNGPDFTAQLSRRLATLERASDGLAEITPPQPLRDMHTAALKAFLNQADSVSRFLYDLQVQHLPWKRAMDGFGRRLSRHAREDKRAAEALTDATDG